jgi:hypothetical protein
VSFRAFGAQKRPRREDFDPVLKNGIRAKLLKLLKKKNYLKSF